MLPKQRLRFRRTTLLTIGLLAFLIGLALARFGIVIPFGLVFLTFVCFLASIWRRRWMALVSVVLFGLAIGVLRGEAFTHKLTPYNELYGQKVVLEVVAGIDAVYGYNGQMTFETKNARVVEPFRSELPGRVKISGFGEPAIFKGDVVRVEGKLFSIRGGKQGQISYAQMKVTERGEGAVDNVRREFAAGMYSALPEPAASFGLGILIGQRNTLPDDVSKQLAAVGLTHIIAVSGYNLTIIVDAVRRLMKSRSKYQTVLVIGLLISLFLAMTGMSASIVRASIVSMLSIAAWYYGRKFKPVLLIAFAAAVTAGWNPLYLWGDIGWYLSFLAFFGVLVIAPLVMRRLYGAREPKFLQAIIVETVSAQIMTLPLILYIFQQMSVISILSNVLIVPLVPIAMLLALIAGLAGMWMPLLAGWFAWPAKLLLTYVLDLAGVLSKVPFALTQHSLSLIGLIGMYTLIVLATVVLWRKTPRFARLTDITDDN